MTNEASAWTNRATRLLRTLILLNLAATLLGVAVVFFGTRLLPQALRDYLDRPIEGELSVVDSIEMFAYGVDFVFTVIGLVGLWYGRRYGVRIYFASCLLLIVLAFFGQPTVASAPSMALATLSSMLGGAILGVAYTAERPLNDVPRLLDDERR